MKCFSHGQWIEVAEDTFGTKRPKWYFRRLLYNMATHPPGLKLVPCAGPCVVLLDGWIGLYALTPGEIKHPSFRLMVAK